MIVGNNPVLLNVTYQWKDKETGQGEGFEVVYRSDDGVVRRSLEPAEIDIYFVKEQFRDFTHNKPQEHMDRMYKRRVLVSEVYRTVANEMGAEGQTLLRNAQGKIRAMKKVLMWPYSYGADFQPEVYFRKEWARRYPSKTIPRLTKGFLDIEVESIDTIINLDNIPNSAHAKVNCVTVVLDETMEAFTFILRPYEPSKFGYSEEQYKYRHGMYLQQKKSHDELMADLPGFIKELNDSFDPTYGRITYKIREYVDEINLIADIFALINVKKPNFCLYWNMRFDAQYLMHRIQALGYHWHKIICHPDFPNKKCWFKVDRSTHEMKNQSDTFNVSGYTSHVCQMRLYGGIRKSQSAMKSISLNKIADLELRDRKVEYGQETNMREFPFMDWKKFIKYNIKDALLQFGIERKVNDIRTYYMRSFKNITPYEKVFRETHLLRNYRELYFNKIGWVQGNNINMLKLDKNEEDMTFYEIEGVKPEDDDDEKGSFKGAILAEPLKNANVGVAILGTPSNVLFINLMDFDMSAFYPTCKIICNMDGATIIFQAMFINQEFLDGVSVNRSLNQKYTETDKYGNVRKVNFTGEAIHTYVSGNLLTFCHNWLNYPSVSDIHAEIERRKRAKKVG